MKREPSWDQLPVDVNVFEREVLPNAVGADGLDLAVIPCYRPAEGLDRHASRWQDETEGIMLH